MLPSDAKSQNSDYGSFCHTPSDTFGHPDSSHQTRPSSSGGASSPTGHIENGGQGDTQRQPLLPPNPESDSDTSSDDDAGANSSGYMRRKAKLHKGNSDAIHSDTTNNHHIEDSSSDIVESSARIKGEPIKTLLAGVFLVFAWVATTTSLALTHERVPDIDPLPDLVLDNIKYQPWGLDASEIVIMICTLMAFTVALFHKHR